MLALLLVLAATWAYSTSFRGVFVWDDTEAIVDNPHIKSLWPLGEAASAPANSTVAGRPLAALSLALNYALAPADARDVMSPTTDDRFHRNVWGYHAFNLVVHLLAALALFGVLRQTRPRRSTGDAVLVTSEVDIAWLSFAVALLWSLHPLQTESVSYVIQRVESLMALFYLLTLYCAIRAWTPGRAGRWWTAAAIAASACGMATKEVMVTAPLMVVLWDWIFGPGIVRRADLQVCRIGKPEGLPYVLPASWRETVRRRWPLYVGLALTWIPLGVLVAELPRATAVGYGYGWTWWSYLITQSAVITQYLRLSVFPSPLIFDYHWPPAASFLAVAPQAIFVTALVVGSIWLVVKRRPVGFLGAWFFLILAPTSSILPIATESAAEHRMYLPLAAVIALIVVGAWQLAISRMPGLKTRPPLAGAIVLAMAATTYGWMTHERNRDYWSSETLWARTVADRPENARARAVYAVSLLAGGQYGDAEHQLREAIRLDDGSALAYRNLGIVLCATQRTAECLLVLQRAAALEPGNGETYGLLGEAYLTERQPVRAVEEFQRAIDLLPDNRASRFLLYRTAWLLATLPDAAARNGGTAVALAERGVRLTSRQDARMLDALAAAYAETDRFADALTAGREALALAQQQRDRELTTEIDQHLVAFAAGQKLRQFQSP